MTTPLRNFLSKLLGPKRYLWLRWRLDKYFGWKGMDPAGVLHHYWKTAKAENAPETYLLSEKNEKRSRAILGAIQKRADKRDAILELGCNVGRNLEFLREDGFSNLHSVEINSAAIELLRKTYPELAAGARITNSSMEDFFRRAQQDYDVIFSSAVLEHLPRESEWVFDEIARRSKKWVVTLEAENTAINFHRIVGRPYKDVFERRGFDCVETESFPEGHALGQYTLRVFRKKA